MTAIGDMVVLRAYGDKWIVRTVSAHAASQAPLFSQQGEFEEAMRHGRPPRCIGWPASDVLATVMISAAEEGGYWAKCGQYPGMAAQGESLSELQSNLEDAANAWREAQEPKP